MDRALAAAANAGVTQALQAPSRAGNIDLEPEYVYPINRCNRIGALTNYLITFQANPCQKGQESPNPRPTYSNPPGRRRHLPGCKR